MRLPPPSILSTWPPPNYTHPTTQSHSLITLASLFLSLTILAVAGRFYSRTILKRRWAGYDDTMIALALLFTIGMTTTVILANVSYGWNRHVWDLPPSLFEGAGRIAVVAKLCFTLAATCTRLSLLCFYYRLVRDSGMRWFGWVLHVNVGFSVGIGVGFVGLSVWLCVPVRAYWTFPPIPGSKCLDEGRVMLIGGIINSVADLLTTVLPIPIVMRLQMPLKQRVGVCVLLCLGFVVTVAGVLRTYFIWKSLIETYDQTWYSYPLWICAMIEIDVAVICACAPAWKSVLHHSLHKVRHHIASLGSTKQSHNSSDSSQPRTVSKWTQLSTLIGRSRHGSEDTEKTAVERESTEFQGLNRLLFRRMSDSTIECNTIPPAPLRIMKRLSIEQRTSFIKEDVDGRRRSFGGSVPVSWWDDEAVGRRNGVR